MTQHALARVFSRLWPVLCVISALSCGDTGSERVRVELRVQGTAESEKRVGDATYRLTRAEVAFGPAYFCATDSAQASQCETALAELTRTVTIDGLSDSARAAGEFSATTGEVRSALYDYGIVFLLTQSAPSAQDNAPDGHSALLEGSVERAGESRRFRAHMDVVPTVPGDSAVSAQRTQHEIKGEGELLTVSVDPYAWLERIDVDALFALEPDASGVTWLVSGTQPYEALLQAMQNRAPARFDWQD
jgi:hypothetical protein